VGAENFFLFGLTVARSSSAGPKAIGRGRSIKKMLNCARHWASSPRRLFAWGSRAVCPIVRSLLEKDPFLLCADFQSYVDCQARVGQLYRQKQAWTRMSILNTARMANSPRTEPFANTASTSGRWRLSKFRCASYRIPTKSSGIATGMSCPTPLGKDARRRRECSSPAARPGPPRPRRRARCRQPPRSTSHRRGLPSHPAAGRLIAHAEQDLALGYLLDDALVQRGRGRCDRRHGRRRRFGRLSRFQDLTCARPPRPCGQPVRWAPNREDGSLPRLLRSALPGRPSAGRLLSRLRRPCGFLKRSLEVPVFRLPAEDDAGRRRLFPASFFPDRPLDCQHQAQPASQATRSWDCAPAKRDLSLTPSPFAGTERHESDRAIHAWVCQIPDSPVRHLGSKLNRGAGIGAWRDSRDGKGQAHH